MDRRSPSSSSSIFGSPRAGIELAALSRHNSRVTSTILVLTALWHSAAFWHFAIHPKRTLARATRERPVSDVSAELFRFLGGINAGFVVLALASLALPVSERWPAFVALAVANLSQLIIDLRVKRLGLAHGGFFRQVMIGDALFTAANAGAGLISLI